MQLSVIIIIQYATIKQCIDVGAQSTLGGTKYVLKISEMFEFYMIFARKLSKYPNFYDICPKNLQNSP